MDVISRNTNSYQYLSNKLYGFGLFAVVSGIWVKYTMITDNIFQKNKIVIKLKEMCHELCK